MTQRYFTAVALGVAAISSVAVASAYAETNQANTGPQTAQAAPAPAPLKFAAPIKKPLAGLTCEELNSVADTFKPKIVAWGAAYAQGYKKPNTVVVDIEGSERITPVVIDACKKAPKESLWQKVKAEVKKLT